MVIKDRKEKTPVYLDEDDAGMLQEIIENRKRSRWLRAQADMWVKWALAIIPVAIAVYVTFIRGGR